MPGRFDARKDVVVSAAVPMTLLLTDPPHGRAAAHRPTDYRQGGDHHRRFRYDVRPANPVERAGTQPHKAH